MFGFFVENTIKKNVLNFFLINYIDKKAEFKYFDKMCVQSSMRSLHGLVFQCAGFINSNSLIEKRYISKIIIKPTSLLQKPENTNIIFIITEINRNI